MLSNIIESVKYPNEIRALYKLYTKHKAYKPDNRPLDELAIEQGDLDFCYSTLGKVSRSFSVVIQQLPKDLRDAVCIFYLVLRALDSIEDDTSIDFEVRKRLLRQFHTFLDNPEWNIKGIGDQKDYRTLLKHFNKVTACFNLLEDHYKDTIRSITREMGEGMILYLDKEIKTHEEYDEYCYYVAGLVGVGLTDLFISSGLEPQLATNDTFPVSMGLFLQKTNIIRDFREDIDEGRTFWPKEIWSKHVSDFQNLKILNESSLDCLNEMITDALNHAEDCLSYLKLIQNPLIFNFCAIPQVMAIATLSELYSNPNVFVKNVKIRKGLAADLIFKATHFKEVHKIFKETAQDIYSKVRIEDNVVEPITSSLRAIIQHDIIDNHEDFVDDPISKESLEVNSILNQANS